MVAMFPRYRKSDRKRILYLYEQISNEKLPEDKKELLQEPFDKQAFERVKKMMRTKRWH